MKAPSAAAIWQPTTDHSLGPGVVFTEGEKPENPEKNPDLRDQLQQLYLSSTFEINVHGSSSAVKDNWR